MSVNDTGSLDRILSEAVRQKLAGVTSNDALLSIFLEVLDFSQILVSELETAGESPCVACTSGCAFCCYSQVSIIPLEALLMDRYVKAEFSSEEISALRSRIDRVRSMTAGKSFQQIHAIKTNLPCVFLESGRCSVYTVRPSICRAWSSFDTTACRVAYDSRDPEVCIASSEARNFIFGTARNLFQQFSRDLILQCDTLLLYNAMSDCFSFEDPLRYWGRGELVFHPMA